MCVRQTRAIDQPYFTRNQFLWCMMDMAKLASLVLLSHIQEEGEKKGAG